MVKTSDRRQPRKSQVVIAMSMKKAMKGKKDEPLFLAALLRGWDELDDVKVTPVPREVDEIIVEFGDVIPMKFPARLPLRRVVDHKIKLEPGARPLAQAPYQLSSLEMIELKKQLEELLKVGYIKPSRSPYGAPILF